MGELIGGKATLEPRNVHLALQGSEAFIELAKALRVRRHVRAGEAECRQGEFLTHTQRRPKETKRRSSAQHAANGPAVHATPTEHTGPDWERNELHHEQPDVTQGGARHSEGGVCAIIHSRQCAAAQQILALI